MQNKVTNVLLVDDDELDVESVRRAFAMGNIDSPLWVAGNGEEALGLLRGDEYPRERRLVLLDLNMPRMNGIELLRAIRSDPSLQPLSVVVLTTSNEESDRVEAYGLNVAGYLLKPVTFQGFVELMSTIDRYWLQVEMQPSAR